MKRSYFVGICVIIAGLSFFSTAFEDPFTIDFAGPIYGEMWFHNDTLTGANTVIDVEDVWLNVTGFNQSVNSLHAGQTLRGFNFINNNTLQVTVSGLYKTAYSLSYEKSEGGANDREYQIIIAVNGVPQNKIETHRTLTSQNAVGATSGVAFLRLAVNDEINLWVMSVDGTDNIGSHTSNVNLIKIDD